MKFRFALAALATTAMGLAIAQTPAPTPAIQRCAMTHWSSPYCPARSIQSRSATQSA